MENGSRRHFEQIRAGAGVEPFSLQIIDYNKQQPASVTFANLEECLSISDSSGTNFQVLRHLIDNRLSLVGSDLIIVPISKLYLLIHEKLAYQIQLSERSASMNVHVLNYAMRLGAVSERHGRDAQLILEEGVAAFNQYHELHHGVLGPAVCAEGGQNYFEQLNANTPLEYVVTSEDSMTLGALEEMHDILWLVLNEAVKVQNKLLDKGNFECPPVPLGHSGASGLIKMGSNELLTLVQLFTKPVDSGSKSEGTQYDFDLTGLETAVVQLYLSSVFELVPAHFPFKYKRRAGNAFYAALNEAEILSEETVFRLFSEICSRETKLRGLYPI